MNKPNGVVFDSQNPESEPQQIPNPTHGKYIKVKVDEKIYKIRDRRKTIRIPELVEVNDQHAINELSKNTAIKAKKDEQTLEGLQKKSNRILFIAKTWSFFGFKTNIIQIDESRVTITYRHFLGAVQLHSIDIKDISNIFIDTAPLFATVEIISRTFVDNHIILERLIKKDALKVRQLIESLRIVNSEGIDTSKYTQKDLLEKLLQLNNTTPIM